LAVTIEPPIATDTIRTLKVGEQIQITGKIYTARDAALPRLVSAIKNHTFQGLGIDLEGGVIFHSAFSVAGVGPTTSSKVEIEESIAFLSRHGIRIHIGKGALSRETTQELDRSGAIFAVTPPVSALLTSTVIAARVVAFEEEGMEAIHELEVQGFPAIVAICQGQSIYDA
jgi:fumarate hydratase subunit beta